MKIDPHIINAIKSGPVPKVRNWRRIKIENLTRAERNMAFAERFLKVPEGEFVGQPIKLMLWQEVFFYSVFDNPAGTKLAILSCGRKNSKTVTSAMILLSYICGPEAIENSMIASGALSREQAGLVFQHMSKFIAQSEALQKATRVITSGKKIIGLSKNVTFTSIAKDGGRTMGRSDIVVLGDEWGQIRGPTDDFIDALFSGQGAYGDKALKVVISTQAASDADWLSQTIDDAQRSNDPRIVCHLYTADEDCELLDREQWLKANPALGVFRSEDDLREQLEMAERLPSKQASALNLLLNRRIALEQNWLAPGPWKDCSGDPDWSVFRENGVTIGLDLSSRTDLTAAVIAACDDDGVVHVYPYVFTPMNGLEDRAQRDRAPYGQWVKDGFMVAVPGATVDYDFVAQYLRDELDDKGIEVLKIAFDRWRISIWQKACEDCGAFPYAEWQEVGQGYRDFSPRLESTEALMLGKRLRHGGHPLLNMAAANAIAVSDPAGSKKLDKSRSTLRIDPLVAMVMAAHEVSESENVGGGFDIAAIIG